MKFNFHDILQYRYCVISGIIIINRFVDFGYRKKYPEKYPVKRTILEENCISILGCLQQFPVVEILVERFRKYQDECQMIVESFRDGELDQCEYDK